MATLPDAHVTGCRLPPASNPAPRRRQKQLRARIRQPAHAQPPVRATKGARQPLPTQEPHCQQAPLTQGHCCFPMWTTFAGSCEARLPAAEAEAPAGLPSVRPFELPFLMYPGGLCMSIGSSKIKIAPKLFLHAGFTSASGVCLPASAQVPPRPTRCPRAPCHAPPAHFACPTRLRAPFAHPPCGNALFCHPPNRAVFAPGPTAARLATNAPRLARPTATNHSRPHFAVFANMPIPPIVAFFHEPTNCCPPCDQRVPPCATNRHQPFPPALCRFCQHAHPANRCLFPGADQLWPALRPPCPALQPPWPALFRKPRARTCKKKKKNFHKSVLFE
ncbi:hypothetical protein BX667DRAFT_506801 [Coemansia mojavensis]|nr:hypothetical protein BX667DRAFT_506801 [Coemansia mojavensis]